MSYANLDYITGRVQQRLEGGVVTDDGRVDHDVLQDAVQAARVFFIQERFRNRMVIPKPYYQRLCCLSVNCRDVGCDGEVSGTKEYYIEIPAVLGGMGKRTFGFVGTGDGNIGFDYVPSMTALTGRPFPFGGFRTPLFTLRGDRELVLRNLPVAGMELACVEAIYADPLDPLIVECSDGSYPISAGDIQVIEDLVVERYIKLPAVPPDLRVDAVPNK